MRFVHERNKNNRYNTKRDEFAWHSILLTNRLRFTGLFVVINELIFTAVKTQRNGQPALRKEFLTPVSHDQM